MNEWQIALIVAGVLLIIGIYCLTKFQERKIQKDEEAYRVVERDALLDAPIEKGIEALEDLSDADRYTLGDLLTEPTLHETTQSGYSAPQSERGIEGPLVHSNSLRETDSISQPISEAGDDISGEETEADDDKLSMPPGFDPKFDYIVGIVGNPLLPGAGLTAAISQLRLSKKVQWKGVAEDSEEWSDVVPDEDYRYVCVALQLVDPKGPIDQAEIDLFQGFIQQVATGLDGYADLPSGAQLISRAQALDAFCANVDIQIGINVVSVSGQPFNGTKIRALAEASGCFLGDDGCFHKIDVATGKELFTLYNIGDHAFTVAEMKNLKTMALGLTLSVPLVEDGVTVFNQMLLFAKQLAQTLGGRLVDVNNQSFGDSMIEAIRKQVGIYQNEMIREGVMPGSSLAKRLFR